MPRTKSKSFTKEQEDTMVAAKALGMPNDQVAALVGVSCSTYERHLKKNVTLRDRVLEGRARASLTARNTLFKLATKKEDVNALKFYLQTQEGFRITDRVEHTGADGRPIQTKAIGAPAAPTREQILAEIRMVTERLAAAAKQTP